MAPMLTDAARQAFDTAPPDSDDEPLFAPKHPMKPPSMKKMADVPKRKRGGTILLWLLMFLLVLSALGAGAYLQQDLVVGLWPPADTILMDLGLRREKPGAGLIFKDAGQPERMTRNGSEVLVMRGIIANISDRKRVVPPIRLILLDKDDHPVQSTEGPPPVATLDPGGTAGFSLQLERPDANAIKLNVVFVEKAPEPAKVTEPAKPEPTKDAAPEAPKEAPKE